MKIAVIGGGSTYTPELVDGFIARAKKLGLTELALMDIDEERLSVVGTFAQRMVEHAGRPFRVSLTTDRRAALDGAAFVSTQFRVGKQPARYQDELLGLRHGLIGQETTGIGGMAKALRTLPVIFSICEDMDRYCPNAWLINFTNPSGLVTEAILNFAGREKAVGLCNVPIDMKMTVAKHLRVPDEAVDMDVIGLNHLGWVRRVTVNGEDVTARLLHYLASEEGPKNIPDVDFKPELIEALQAVPLYYNRYYYNTERVLALLQAKPKTRAQEVMAVEETLLAKYRDPDLFTKPEELNLRGGAYYSKIAIDVIDALVNDLGIVHAVNVRNQGAIPGLPDRFVVETNCTIGRDGARPRSAGEPDESMLALLFQAKMYEILTIKAALHRSYAYALKAIFTNPLGPTADRAKPILDDMIAVNRLDLK
ncbi:MAG: 6-phospho-beta-glucosidase [Myxococcales bacterium]|nr:6-phospho-beta-glucosidase [Myxococcales bacterium]